MPDRQRRADVFAAFIFAGVAALLAIWLYWRALRFGYFNDDPTGHFAWMEGKALWDFFRSSADYGYYRPVVFATLRLMEALFGGAPGAHNSAADHALVVLLHAANTGMVWLLAYRLGRRAAYAWVAALAFATVPFSYEAVAYVASLTHPLFLFWLLLTLLLYDAGRGSGRPLFLGLALVTMSLGLLTHENGLFIFPALVGLEWVRREPRSLHALLPRPLWFFAVPPVVFAVIWLLVPKNSDQGLNGLAAMGRNAVPFLQTLIYPLLPALPFDSGDVVWLALTVALVILAVGYLAFAAGALRLWAYALGWVALSSLPSLLFLSPDYLYGSPRLSYLPAVGVALFWGLPVLWLWRWAGSRRGQTRWLGSPAVRLGLTVTYVLLLVLPPLPFIRCQLDFYGETTRLVRSMAETARVAPPGQDIVFVNVPYFFSSYAGHPDGCPNPYPWTPVGAVAVPPYAQAQDFVRFNAGPDRPAIGGRYEGYAPGWKTYGLPLTDAALRAAVANDAVAVYDLNRGDFFDLSRAWQPGKGGAGNAPATFGGVLDLASVRLLQDGDRLSAALRWRALAPLDGPLSTFVHVYDETGTLAAQHDGPLAGGYAPAALVQPGDLLVDTATVDLSGLPAGDYRVAVGVYRAADGSRLEAISAGQLLPDNVYTVTALTR